MKFVPTTVFLLFVLFTHGQEEVFTIVESMPSPENCSGLDAIEKNACTRNSANEYIREHIVYPQPAIDKQQRGTVWVSFVINKEGRIKQVQILRGISGAKESDEEARRVVSSMSSMNWTPGMQGGKEVAVRYNLPIKFNPPKPQTEIPAK